MTTIALPRPRNALLDRLRTIQIGVGARGAVGVGLATKAGGVVEAGVDWSQWFVNFWLFKGAASQETSYVDRVAGLTMTLGTAPTWNAATGLTFNGSNQYLNTNFLIASGMTLMLQFTGLPTTGGETAMVGHYKNGGARFQIGKQNIYDFLIYAASEVLFVPPALAAGNLAIAGSSAYRNGVLETGSAGGTAIGADQTLLLGARRREDTSGIDLYTPFTAIAMGRNTATLNGTQIAAACAAMAAL